MNISLSFLVILLMSAVPIKAQLGKDLPFNAVYRVSESWTAIKVKSVVPYPPELTDEAQARRLSEEAALTQARDALLTRVLLKTTKSKRPLSTAEIPSLELQKQIRDMVNETPVVKTLHVDQTCTLWLRLPKKQLKRILKTN
jgi:hypothetical protein